MEQINLNEYKIVAQKLICMDGDEQCIFDDREQCLQYFEQYFEKDKAKYISEEIRKGRLRHDTELQNLLENVCGKEIMKNLRTVMFLPSRKTVISKME